MVGNHDFATDEQTFDVLLGHEITVSSDLPDDSLSQACTASSRYRTMITSWLPVPRTFLIPRRPGFVRESAKARGPAGLPSGHARSRARHRVRPGATLIAKQRDRLQG